MADTLSPEQRAYDICEALHLRHGWVQREIADAIRAAETAAVEAERERCADCAETVLFFHEVDWEIRQSVGKVIRALPDPSPTTEADNDC